MTDAARPNPSALRQRLAGLTPAQRALLIRRLNGNETTAPDRSPTPRAIPKCQPLRVEGSSRVAVYPASSGQQRMWFLHHYAAASPVYCIPSAFQLDGSLNLEWLEIAFRRVIQRHDILRTTFAVESGELRQCVSPASGFELGLIDLEKIPAEARDAEAGRILDDESGRPFDLSASPPFRALLLRLRPDGHVLLLVFHHIISDGWSRSNFYRELAATYAALASGKPAPLCELPVQFADYSAWQKNGLAGDTLAAEAAYWKTKLGSEPEPLNLPSDRPRPAAESFRGGRCVQRLDPKLTTALKSRAQEEGATFFMILLAAFKTLLHRYTGNVDLMVGVPIANRQRPEVEALIGYFANTLVMRTTFEAGLTFRELLRRVKETAVEAYAHQNLPFEQLVEVLQVRRDASRTPLFQVSFAIQDFPAVEFNLPAIRTSTRSVSTHTSKFDLSLTIERSPEGWAAAAEYSTDLFDAVRVKRMVQHWCVMLESVAANPDRRLSEIPLLTPDEAHQILTAWNGTERPYPQSQCLHHLFEAQARRMPEAVAVEFEGKHLSYRQLDDRANDLARRLRARSVGPDVLVGLCMERSLDLVVGLFGILKAGGAYVPLDPKYPAERIEFILKDADAQVLVTQRHVKLGTDDLHLLCIEDESSPAAAPQYDQLTEIVPITPANLAYVIYTSGSTGKPKGVAIEHRSAVSFLHWVRDAFTDAELSGVLASTSVCFDLSIFEIFGPLSWGGRTVLANNLFDLGASGVPKNVALINTVPSALAEFLNTRSLPPAIRTVNLAGEPLRQDLVETIFKKTSAERVNDLYGPTETTVYSTWTRRHPGGNENVGRPIANTQIYILDACGQPVPVGVDGELHIGGAGVARGYWRRPELTAERFIPDHFSGRAGDRLFKTGDRARWLADGNVLLLGRADGQVKLRGFRIELGEIEAALRACPEVRDAAVIVREDRPGNPQLVAYLTAGTNNKPDTPALRIRLAQTLPEYMLPNAFVWLDKFPLTPNGKVNRQAMPAPEPNIEVNHPHPATLLELKLIRIWRRLFHLEDIGRNDNFFDLGGHSLLALRLTAEIEKLANRRVPIAALFQAPTVATLARKLEDENWAPRSSLVPLQPNGSKLPVFCIHGIYGHVYGFVDLARELAPDRPVYGLQAVGLDGRQPRHGTVEQMAAHYAREIRAVQPAGPYHLVGVSLGGWIAYEVAQELTRHGTKVAVLALLDTRATANIPWPLYARVMAPQLAHRTVLHLKRWLAGPQNGRLPYLAQKLNWLRLHLTQTRRNLPIRPLTGGAPPANPHDFTLDYFDAVAAGYRPSAKYPGDVTVFAGVDAKYFRHSSFWKHFVSGRIRVQMVKGGHGSLISQTHVAEFAKVFEKTLCQAEEDAGILRPT